MTKEVVFHFNLRGPNENFRPDETPSFQHHVSSLGDVPTVGDYVDMLRYTEATGYHTTAVKVVGRRIMFSPHPEGGRYAPDDPLTIIVTLMVEKASRESGMPDFRPS
jgi:hypothetical protein